MASQSDIDAHLQAVAALKAQEASQRYDHAALTAMTADEARANTIFTNMRDAERESQWEKEGDLASFAGMDFYGARKNGLGSPSDVWNAVRRMPKGALLHCHFDGTVDTSFLLEHAKKTPGMAMKADRALTKDSLWSATVEFLVLPESEDRSNVSIWSEEYAPGSWVSFEAARESFPYPHPYELDQGSSHAHMPAYMELSKPAAQPNGTSAPGSSSKGDAFDAYVHSLMTLTPHEAVPAITNSKQAWSKFQSTFGVIAGLIGYEPTLKAYTKELVLSHARDGISYTEARINFLTEFMVRSDGTPTLTHEDWVRIFIEAVTEAKAELGEGVFVDAKIIYTTVRFIDNDKLRWYLEDCISLKKLFPEWIVGFDLVGHEDPLLPLKHYIPELLRFQHRCAEEGISIPFVFHAGETLTDGGDADLNLYDAILLNTRRIGHGVSLARHPTLTDLVKEKDICVEICPISNQVLGYTASICSHPSLLALLNRNVPVALSSDDPSIFENFGLSYDFYQLVISSKSTSLVSLAALARRSIRYALVDDEAKQRMVEDWDKRWKKFVGWFLKEYGHLARQ
ncbi:Adenosine/AMP deaminase domain protein [Kalmanozyma brasiliensis GHG001]|uniref:Adenosine deaminase n=1 Tax=Kalmanozyma brasiliensis (strain GHG001) TaxID=1365824 RepID=V5ERH9_KALBG|nr:Adenosine/AMP deaminase domain protein [Kalmanozyma brasiliensis GHG001]EST07745.1 Adenosine/AMP deaminase domain protein [Kalmanozyma brasiliensis GHG001]